MKRVNLIWFALLLSMLFVGWWWGRLSISEQREHMGQDRKVEKLPQAHPSASPEMFRDGALPEKNAASIATESPLDALLRPNVSPQEQTSIVGQMLIDYWTSTHSLPTGEWSEVVEQLAGKNGKGLVMVPASHPSIGSGGFCSSPQQPKIILHVISCKDCIFQLIYCGKDGLAYTEDDLIRNFPADFDGNWNGR